MSVESRSNDAQHSRGLTSWAGPLWIAYAGLSAAHLVTQLTGADWADRLSQALLMPLLAMLVWTATSGAPRSRLVRLVLVALGFSWLGDTVPGFLGGDAAFLSMVGLFLCAQIAYLTAFWPFHRSSVLRKPAVAGYVVAFAALLVACVPGAGVLAGPVVVYGVCLALMAVLATGVHPLAGLGGALFFVSDGLIALGAFADWYRPPVPGFWVMTTYLAAQALLVAGALRRERPRH